MAKLQKKAPKVLKSRDAELKSALAFRRREGAAKPTGSKARDRASRSKRPDAAQGLDALVGNPALAQDRLASRPRRGDFSRCA
jgi:hypothetical protein